MEIMYRFPRTANEQSEHRQNRPQEPSPPSHLEIVNTSKSHPGDAEHVSIVEPSIAQPQVVAPTGTANLSKNWTNPKLPLRKLHSFLHNPTRATSASTTIPRTVTVRSPRSAVQCALCVPRSACNWKVHHSVEELN